MPPRQRLHTTHTPSQKPEPPSDRSGSHVLLWLLIMGIVWFDMQMAVKLVQMATNHYTQGMVAVGLLAAVPPVTLLIVAWTSRVPKAKTRRPRLRVVRPSSSTMPSRSSAVRRTRHQRKTTSKSL